MTDQTPRGRDGSQSTAASDGMNQGMRVLSLLVAGVLLYGGLGWLGDHFFGTRFLLPVGIVAGAAFGAYTSIRRLTAGLGHEPPPREPARPATSKANGSEGGSR